ncbi:MULTISPECIES: response regulator [Rhizobium/Agrobacterium group]|uniref:response regulator n=1 Tax=Rhizobium/Agrobacterium group TaxID=227290 RepID=UPI000712C974|nr:MULTISPECIES: response regulator [Rhizobium/Agrobacterium group]KQY34233.1 response regulator [Rhizobium sp. Root483D2]
MKIMIVEDEALLALELEEEVEAAGHSVIGQAMSEKQAMAILERQVPEFAFVDVHLTDGPTGIDVGRHLAERGIPYVFVTGNLKRVPDDFVGAIGVIEKPYTMNGLQNALSYIARLLRGDVNLTVPPSIIVGPRGSA